MNEPSLGRGSSTPAVSLTRNEAAVITWVDERMADVLGWAPEQLVGLPSTKFIHPEDQPSAVAAWFDMLTAPGEVRTWRGRYQAADGTWRWVETANRNDLQNSEKPAVYTEIQLIAPKQVDVEEELRARKQLLSRLADAVPVGLFQIDRGRAVTFTNDRLLAILRCAQAATTDAQFAAVADVDGQRLREAFDAVLDNVPVDNLELTFDLPPANGNRRRREPCVCQLALRPLTDSTGSVTGAIGCLSDVTDAVTLRRQLEHRAATDELTQCLNRTATLTQLSEDLATEELARRGCAVVFVDLNGFKLINDRHGHVIGDELLRQAAARLRNAMRTGDTVGRLGGDEFLVVCPDVETPAIAAQMGERIRRAVHADIKISSLTVQLRASVGLAWTDQPIDAMTLVRQADTAMYQSKTTPGSPAVLYRSRATASATPPRGIPHRSTATARSPR